MSAGLLIAVVAPSRPASAQAVYGSVAGTVTDSSGARLPEAQVVLTSLERNTVNTMLSNAAEPRGPSL